MFQVHTQLLHSTQHVLGLSVCATHNYSMQITANKLTETEQQIHNHHHVF